MVRDEKALFPAHKHAVAVAVFDIESWPTKFLLHLRESGKAGPVCHVLLFARTPIVGEKAVPRTNDLGVEVCGELWPVVREAADTKVTTKERGRKVDILARDESGKSAA